MNNRNLTLLLAAVALSGCAKWLEQTSCGQMPLPQVVEKVKLPDREATVTGQIDYLTPEDKSPDSIDVKVLGSGRGDEFVRHPGLESEYCLVGRVVRQPAAVSLTLPIEGEPVTITDEEAWVEWQVDGPGMHVAANWNLPWDEVDGPVRTLMQRIYDESRDPDPLQYASAGVYLLVDSEDKPDNGYLQVDAGGRTETRNWSVFGIVATLSFPD